MENNIDANDTLNELRELVEKYVSQDSTKVHENVNIFDDGHFTVLRSLSYDNDQVKLVRAWKTTGSPAMVSLDMNVWNHQVIDAFTDGSLSSREPDITEEQDDVLREAFDNQSIAILFKEDSEPDSVYYLVRTAELGREEDISVVTVDRRDDYFVATIHERMEVSKFPDDRPPRPAM